MKVARFVLKIVSISLAAAAVVCAVVGYWDKICALFAHTGEKAKQAVHLPSEYDDFAD